MELEGSLQHLQQPTTCPYLEPDEFTLSVSFLLLLQNTLCIYSPETVFSNTTRHKAPHYATFSIFLQHQILET